LVGMALHRGLIGSLDDQVTDYLPQLTGTAYEGATIRHVMNMSSGMAIDGLSPQGGFDDTVNMMEEWVAWGTSFSDQIAKFGRAVPPGTKWNYNNLDTHVLSMLVQKLSGMSFAETVSAWMWTPLNASADATWLINTGGADGEALGFCCLQATAQDYARLGLLMLNDGVWNGERLLPEGWVAQVQNFPSKHLERGHSNYHLQWWQDPARPGQYAAKGRWGQAVYVSHPDNVVVVRFSIDPKEMEHGAEQWAADAAIAKYVAAQ
ncbi:MAG: serine hydrolase domain-containing protein, partial [Alphaproteobacteria bacterium]